MGHEDLFQDDQHDLLFQGVEDRRAELVGVGAEVDVPLLPAGGSSDSPLIHVAAVQQLPGSVRGLAA